MELNYSTFAQILICLIALQRLWEMRISRRNERRLLEKGAMEYAPKHFTLMKVVHASWLGACLWSALVLKELPSNLMLFTGASFLIAGQVLRWVAISTLGERWTVKIFVLPEAPAISGGIYKWIRHPNYVGVILELIGLPLLVGSIEVAIAASIANAVVLILRIRAEERALSEHCAYQELMSSKGRFIP